MRLPQEILIYSYKSHKSLFLLMLSSYQGWGLVKIKKNQFALYRKNLFFLLDKNFAFKSYHSFLINYTFGLYTCYLQYLKLKGMGYKIVVNKNNLILKLGYSHRIIYNLSKDIVIFYYNRQFFSLKSRSKNTINHIVSNFIKVGKTNIYKKKGIFIKGSCIKTKISSKKSKF